MSPRKFTGALLLWVVILVSGCSTCGTCGLTQEIVDEMNIWGVTITSLSAPEHSSETVLARLDTTVSPAQVVALIHLFVAPKPDDLFVDSEGLLNYELSSFPYRYSFSIFENGSYLEIPQSEEIKYTNLDQGSYGGHLKLDVPPSEKFDYGNYTLTSGAQLRIPIKATHIEIWFQENSDIQRELVRRVPLKNLSGWHRHFKRE